MRDLLHWPITTILRPGPGIPRSHRFACSRPLTLREGGGASCVVQCSVAMVQSVKATYRDGVLEPLESLDLVDGDVVTLSISVEGGAKEGEVIESASVGNGVVDGVDSETESQTGPDNGEHPLLQRLRKIRESVPASAWDGVPTDGARNYKHYLYGHPKVD